MESVPNTASSLPYTPVLHHWFYKRVIEGRELWEPFSTVDSFSLEHSFNSADFSSKTVVATDGGRYDVNISRRERFPVYWIGDITEVRRCSWFQSENSEGHLKPYEEDIAALLEQEFRKAYEADEWHRKIELPNGDIAMFHGPDVLVWFPSIMSFEDPWGNTSSSQPRVGPPKVVKRGTDGFDIDQGEPGVVDHLLFVIHGIGPACDMKLRSIQEVVDEFRKKALQLVRSHYASSYDKNIVNRIEVLPISWHSKLHKDTGIDKNLKKITLESIPLLRHFANDTLADILFYTSSPYCQNIMSIVGTELNRIYGLFKQRNLAFKGAISLVGHSLGSIILFDLLSHQHTEKEDDVEPLKKGLVEDGRLKSQIGNIMTKAGSGQLQLQYPHLDFQPNALFTIGSPIGLFITVRGLEFLGNDFALPTCPAFFNIFHPYDPVAYRIESLINPELENLKPVLIPHHKGRKRMHLELKDTMAQIGANWKQKVVDSMNSFLQTALFIQEDADNVTNLKSVDDKVVEKRHTEEGETAKQALNSVQSKEEQNSDLCFGLLNKGRRIDYVLQEAPHEIFNEYIFAIGSHLGYWESDDTALMILKEIYDSMGIRADNEVLQ